MELLLLRQPVDGGDGDRTGAGVGDENVVDFTGRLHHLLLGALPALVIYALHGLSGQVERVARRI
ncbi:hypothetical protein [Streptomyces sp. M10]|uniref:hypothetical protein n=1 Tax=Streptomyces sp. M10 TaxID=412968 RepID=UPI0006482530|nr:hypothetical protein [Streptomyces sp. M10]